MTLLRPLFDARASIESPTMPLSAAGIAEFLGWDTQTDSGVSISETSSLGNSAVWRAVNVTAGVSSSLPLKTYKYGTRQPVVVRLLDNPHPDMTPKELWELAYVHMMLWGNAYFRKVRNDAGMLTWLLPIPPSCVKAGRVKDWQQVGMISPKIYEVERADGYGTEPLTDYEILHIPGLGYDGVCGASPIRIARQSLGVAAAAEKHAARLWGAGSLLAGILQTEQRLEPEQAEAMKARWKSMVTGVGKSHEIAVLGSGASFQPVTMPNDDAQFLESRRFQVDEVSRWSGMPPHMLFELSGQTSWGTGIEQMTIGWTVFTLHPYWLSRVEARITKQITPRGVFAEYVLEGLLKGDSQSRAEFYAKAVGGPWMAKNEARRKENLPPVPGGDDVLEPLNMGGTGGPNATQAA